MAHFSRFAPALVAMVLAACGGKSFDVDPDPDPQGGTGNGGSAQGGKGSTAGATNKGGTSSAGTGSGGSGGSAGSTCDGFNDDPGYYVSVAVINKTSAPIYLGQDMVNCGIEPLFDVANEAGSTLSAPGQCNTSCQMLRDGDAIGCPAICAFPSALKLEAGETYYTQWNGLYQVQRELPAECRNSREDISCSQTVQINPGTYRFSSEAGAATDCSQTGGTACGACTPTGNGGCTVPGSLISGARKHATTTVYLDASYGVWGRPTPAPLPAYPGGDNTGGAIALLTVELVFAD